MSRADRLPVAGRLSVVDQVRWRQLLVAAGQDPRSTPARAARACVSELGVDGAAVSVASEPDLRATLCATDARAGALEDLQSTLGVGPGVDAVAHGRAVLVPDLARLDPARHERWTGFAEAAQRCGVLAVFAVPVCVGAVSIGALVLHRCSPGPLEPDALVAATAAADVVAVGLTLDDGAISTREDADTGVGQPWGVHQAAGMVSAQLDVDVSRALLALRARAFAEGRPLSEVAEQVIARRLRFERGD